MSWKDDLNYIEFEITTGDKAKWYPLLIPNYQKNVEYNGTQYDFINKAGSLFARQLPKGNSFPLEFAFKGENNVKQALNFDISARDKRSWTVIHPFYGKIIVQPISLSIDNSGLDCSIIKVTVVETTVALQPKEILNASDVLTRAQEKVLLASFTAMQPISANLPVKNTVLAASYTKNVASRIEKITKDYKAFQENYNQCINELSNMQGITSTYINYAQRLLDMPAQVTMDIGSRWRVIKDSFDYFVANLQGVATLSYFERLFFNLFGCMSVNSMGVALTQKDTFQTRAEAQLYIEKYLTEYNLYLETLYDIENEDFSPNHDYMFAIHSMVCETTFRLYQILFESKQERSYFCEKDTNLVILAHKLLGLASEENINILKKTNNIGLSEILNIKKDREIKYLV